MFFRPWENHPQPMDFDVGSNQESGENCEDIVDVTASGNGVFCNAVNNTLKHYKNAGCFVGTWTNFKKLFLGSK